MVWSVPKVRQHALGQEILLTDKSYFIFIGPLSLLNSFYISNKFKFDKIYF